MSVRDAAGRLFRPDGRQKLREKLAARGPPTLRSRAVIDYLTRRPWIPVTARPR